MANKRVLGVFTLNCLQTGHWVRVDYHIMMDWAHVLVIVQCQTDGCSLSCKKMVLLSGSLLDSWRQAVSPFWKWRLMTAAAPTLSSILEPSLYTSSCDPCASRNSLNLAWASCPEIMHLLTLSMRSCLLGSQSCVPGGLARHGARNILSYFGVDSFRPGKNVSHSLNGAQRRSAIPQCFLISFGFTWPLYISQFLQWLPP